MANLFNKFLIVLILVLIALFIGFSPKIFHLTQWQILNVVCYGISAIAGLCTIVEFLLQHKNRLKRLRIRRCNKNSKQNDR